MNKKQEHIINNSVIYFFKKSFKLSLKYPRFMFIALKFLKQQKKSKIKREHWIKKGYQIPPIIIFSITNTCNLKCKGCYSKAQNRKKDKELTTKKIIEIFDEAVKLGISIIMIAGGEPLLHKDLFNITKHFPNIVFPLFTNGTMLDDKKIDIIKHQKNIVPLLSIEGGETATEQRRGIGTYSLIKNQILKMKNKKILFGVSITLSKLNFSTVTETDFIKKLLSLGCKIFVFVEYIPVKKGTEKLILANKQREILQNNLNYYRKHFNAIFTLLPGDEKELGGCVSAGRGFVHISSNGSLEPCPFAPYSDSNLNHMSLKDALKSNFLNKIRKQHDILNETEGSCALWENRKILENMLNSKNK